MRKKSWIAKITLASVVTSIVFTFVSTNVLGNAGYIASFAALAIFIFWGIIFDVIGVAVTASIEAPFHSMAAHHERGATEAIRLVKNAGKVASVCNDIVGDIAGIVSGTTAALIAWRLTQSFSVSELVMQLVISGAVTGVTIGGKAVGKQFAMGHTTKIVLTIGKILSIFSRTGK